jgi:cytochrome bd-type quinol oxidase subunit 2
MKAPVVTSGSPYEGARIKNKYLDRKQEFVAVNKNDLEDILSFDGMSSFFSSVAMFLLAGATWLLIDKISQMQEFEVTSTVQFLGLCIFCGLVSLVPGVYFHLKKRGRIQRIFDETTEIDRGTGAHGLLQSE